MTALRVKAFLSFLMSLYLVNTEGFLVWFGWAIGLTSALAFLGAEFVAQRDAVVFEAPKKKAAPKEKPAPKKKAAPKEKPAPKKKAAPKEKPVPKKKAAPKEKPAPKKKAAPKEKPAPKKKAAPKEKPVPKKKAAPKEKPAPRKKAAPKEKPAPKKKAMPKKKSASVKKSGNRMTIPLGSTAQPPDGWEVVAQGLEADVFEAPKKKVAPKAKPAPKKKAAPKAKPAPKKKAAPKEKPAPKKKATPKKKSASVKKSGNRMTIPLGSTAQPPDGWEVVAQGLEADVFEAPKKKVAPKAKPAPKKKAAPKAKPAPKKKAAPKEKPAPMKKAAPKKKAASTRTREQPSFSLADEIRKFAELRDEGIITEADFEKQKDRLLGFEEGSAAIGIADVIVQPSLVQQALGAAEQFVQSLSVRDREILERRTVSDDPETLEVLAQGFGLTRERVRQLEKRIKKNLDRNVVPFVRPIARVLADRLGPVVEAEIMASEVRSTFEAGSGVGGLVCCRTCVSAMGYSIGDGVALNEDGLRVVRQLKEVASGEADTVGLVHRGDLEAALPDDGWTRFWSMMLTRAGLHPMFEHVALNKTQGALITAGMLQAAEPVTPKQLSELTRIEEKSLRAALSRRDEIVRVDKTKWWFRDQVDDEYEGIAAEITQRITEDGGSTTLARLLAELPERFGVSESSVRTLVHTPQFEIRDGHVSLADLSQFKFRRLEDVVDGWTEHDEPYWEFQVRANHLRGFSVVGLPPEFADRLGCALNDSIEVPLVHPKGFGTLSVSWKASSPQGPILGKGAKPFGSLGVTAGDRMRLVLRADGSVALNVHEEAVTDTGGGARQVGHSDSSRSEPGPSDILERLKSRRRVL